jgi:hypothetical protein
MEIADVSTHLPVAEIWTESMVCQVGLIHHILAFFCRRKGKTRKKKGRKKERKKKRRAARAAFVNFASCFYCHQSVLLNSSACLLFDLLH